MQPLTPSSLADLLLREFGSPEQALKYAARVAALAEWCGRFTMMRLYDQAAALILVRQCESEWTALIVRVKDEGR
jgi:hypothetical protein